MDWKSLLRAWQLSANLHKLHPPATDAELHAAEQKLGTSLPQPLCDLYKSSNGPSLFNGDLAVWPALSRTTKLPQPFLNPFRPQDKPITESTVEGIDTATDTMRGNGFPIPDQALVFAGNGSEAWYALWMPAGSSRTHVHPVIETGEIFEPDSFAVAATSLLAFFYGLTAYHLQAHGGYDAALDAIGVPASLRSRKSTESDMAAFRRWADPELENFSPDPFTDRLDAAELARRFAT